MPYTVIADAKPGGNLLGQVAVLYVESGHLGVTRFRHEPEAGVSGLPALPISIIIPLS